MNWMGWKYARHWSLLYLCMWVATFFNRRPAIGKEAWRGLIIETDTLWACNCTILCMLTHKCWICTLIFMYNKSTHLTRIKSWLGLLQHFCWCNLTTNHRCMYSNITTSATVLHQTAFITLQQVVTSSSLVLHRATCQCLGQDIKCQMLRKSTYDLWKIGMKFHVNFNGICLTTIRHSLLSSPHWNHFGSQSAPWSLCIVPQGQRANPLMTAYSWC